MISNYEYEGDEKKINVFDINNLKVLNENYQLLNKRFKRNSMLNIKEPKDQLDKLAVKKYEEKKKIFEKAKDNFIKIAKKETSKYIKILKEKRVLFEKNILVQFYIKFLIFPEKGKFMGMMGMLKKKITQSKEIKVMGEYSEKIKEILYLTKKQQEFAQMRKNSIMTYELLNYNNINATKMIPENMYFDLKNLIDDNLSMFENHINDSKGDDINEQKILSFVKTENIILEDYREKIQELPDNPNLEFFKINGYLILKDKIKANRIKVIKNLEKIMDLLTVKLLIELKKPSRNCINLNELSYYVHILIDKNIIGEQVSFFDEI